MERRVWALDGWRAIAVLFVIASHLAAFSSVSDIGVATYLGPLGGLGVQYFFVISGFVIARGLLGEATLSLAAFYIRRCFRILPPLILYLIVVSALAEVGSIKVDLARFWRVLTFTCNDHAGWVCTYIGAHTWSLSVEEQFYLVIPALVSLGVGQRATKLVIFSLIPLVILLYAAKQGHTARLVAPFTFIAVGVACALYESRVRRYVAHVPQILAVAGFAVTVGLPFLPEAAPATALRTVVAPIATATVLMVSALRTGWFEKALNWPPLRALGVVSYGVYIWQQLATFPFPGATGWFYLASVGGCIAFAAASYHFFERPLIRLGARLSDSVRRSASERALVTG